MAVTTTSTSAISPFPKGIHRAWTILAILVVAQIVGQSISMAAGIMVAPLNDPGGAHRADGLGLTGEPRQSGSTLGGTRHD
ncbi:MAG: hypothetical protein NZ876_04875 [Dehalococcoidia bacterium]|nr:hypothetical protein [Dehalococcoidia bacterium]